MYNGPKCLGLVPGDSNKKIQQAAFDFAQKIGYMSFSSVTADGLPNNRGLEVHYLDDEKNLYVGASIGKHFCGEMEHRPYVSAVAVDVVSVRINAWLEKDNRPEIRARYWELNRGTEKMYRKDLSNFQVYRLVRGEGEIFHVYEADAIARLRFSFGGDSPRPFTYDVGEGCTGCGVCAQRCMMDTISVQNGQAFIDHYGCNECGICHASCPHGAVVKNGL